jgi:hypothetical protein
MENTFRQSIWSGVELDFPSSQGRGFVANESRETNANPVTVVKMRINR